MRLADVRCVLLACAECALTLHVLPPVALDSVIMVVRMTMHVFEHDTEVHDRTVPLPAASSAAPGLAGEYVLPTILFQVDQADHMEAMRFVEQQSGPAIAPDREIELRDGGDDGTALQAPQRSVQLRPVLAASVGETGRRQARPAGEAGGGSGGGACSAIAAGAIAGSSARAGGDFAPDNPYAVGLGVQVVIGVDGKRTRRVVRWCE